LESFATRGTLIALNVVLKAFFGQYFTTTVKADFLVRSNKSLKDNPNKVFSRF
jgi:hypothetical protein